MTGTPFLVAEIEVATYISAKRSGRAWGASPWAKPRGPLSPIERDSTIRVSEIGYRTRSSDPGGVVAYPPLLLGGLTIDRHVPLDPAQSAVTVSIGAIELINPDGRWDDMAGSGNVDGRAVRLLRGTTTRDDRGYDVHPAYADLVPVHTGVGRPWQLSEDTLSIPVQDNTYLLVRTLRINTYAGTGGVNGDAQAKGQPIALVRGGRADAPVHQVPLRLIDAAREIYAYTDGAGTVTILYEDGDGSRYVADGDVADLWAGTYSVPGHYRTCNALGLLQLGGTPLGSLMVDCTGAFRSAGPASNLVDVVRALLLEEMDVPPELVDAISFAAAGAAYPWPVGIRTDGTAVTGAALITLLLGGTGLRIVPQRNGKLGLLRMRAPDPAEAVAATWTTAQVASCTPYSLGSPLDPPAYRWQVGWRRNHTTVPNAASTLSAVDRQIAADEYQYAASLQRAVHLSAKQPSDPPPLATALLRQADAQSGADTLSATWTAERRGYALTVPVKLAETVELMDQLHVTYPVGPFRRGALCRVVGEQVRTGDPSTTIQVIV